MTEKERWQEQRIYLNTALKISTFLRDCYEIKKQLESWRQDLQGLRHSVSNTVEIIKQYHTQNTVKVQQVVSDAMKQLSEILEVFLFIKQKIMRNTNKIKLKMMVFSNTLGTYDWGANFNYGSVKSLPSQSSFKSIYLRDAFHASLS